MEYLKELIGSVLMNPAVQAIIVGFIFTAIGWGVKRVKDEKYDAWWRSIQGAAVTAFNFAEKVIPDDTDNKSLKKIDEALKYFNENVAEKFGRNATKNEFEIAKDLWAEMSYEIKKK